MAERYRSLIGMVFEVFDEIGGLVEAQPIRYLFDGAITVAQQSFRFQNQTLRPEVSVALRH